MHPVQIHNSYLSSHRAAPRAAAPARPGALRRWMTRALRQWQRRKMIAALTAMDPRILQDIGIEPGDIERAVDGFDDRELRMSPMAGATRPVTIDDDLFRRAA